MVAIGWTQEPERQRGKLLISVWQDKEDKTGIGKVKYVTQRKATQHNTRQSRWYKTEKGWVKNITTVSASWFKETY